MTGVREAGAFTRPCDAPAPHVSRRAVLMAGALVPAAWAVPQVVSVPVAWANPPHSAPPRSSKPPVTPEPFATDMGPALPEGIELAYTGTEQRKEVEVALSAIGAGVAVWAATREPKRTTE